MKILRWLFGKRNDNCDKKDVDRLKKAVNRDRKQVMSVKQDTAQGDNRCIV